MSEIKFEAEAAGNDTRENLYKLAEKYFDDGCSVEIQDFYKEGYNWHTKLTVHKTVKQEVT